METYSLSGAWIENRHHEGHRPVNVGEDIFMERIQNTPKVSVVIPVYNVEEYVGECLDCLEKQTFRDF